eukprot:11573388-Karenia_brevis.AAC.1
MKNVSSSARDSPIVMCTGSGPKLFTRCIDIRYDVEIGFSLLTKITAPGRKICCSKEASV